MLVYVTFLFPLTFLSLKKNVPLLLKVLQISSHFLSIDPLHPTAVPPRPLSHYFLCPWTMHIWVEVPQLTSPHSPTSTLLSLLVLSKITSQKNSFTQILYPGSVLVESKVIQEPYLTAPPTQYPVGKGGFLRQKQRKDDDSKRTTTTCRQSLAFSIQTSPSRTISQSFVCSTKSV